jgi:excisionase family DNA binding protein
MLTVAQFARETGLKEPTIRLWIAKRLITYVKLGRAVRIPDAELSRLLRENTVPAREQRDGR